MKNTMANISNEHNNTKKTTQKLEQEHKRTMNTITRTIGFIFTTSCKKIPMG
jgi:hypothetical protein